MIPCALEHTPTVHVDTWFQATMYASCCTRQTQGTVAYGKSTMGCMQLFRLTTDNWDFLHLVSCGLQWLYTILLSPNMEIVIVSFPGHIMECPPIASLPGKTFLLYNNCTFIPRPQYCTRKILVVSFPGLNIALIR